MEIINGVDLIHSLFVTIIQLENTNLVEKVNPLPNVLSNVTLNQGELTMKIKSIVLMLMVFLIVKMPLKMKSLNMDLLRLLSQFMKIS
jgi:hypothetical protein